MPNFDVNLRLVLDEAGVARVKAGISSVEQELEKIQKPKTVSVDAGDPNEIKQKILKPRSADFFKDYKSNFQKNAEITIQEAQKMGVAIDEGILSRIRENTSESIQLLGELDAKMKNLGKTTKPALDFTDRKTKEELIKLGYTEQAANKRIAAQIKQQQVLKEQYARTQMDVVGNTKAEETASKKITAEQQIQYSQLRMQAREMTQRARMLTREASILRNNAGDWDRLFTPLLRGGTVVAGGIFALATKYVNNAKEATETTVQWKNAQQDLNKQQARIGEILATEALPLIKLAAQYITKAADILEKHPEVVGIALKAGIIAIAIGTIGKAVTSGIRLYADLKMQSAMMLQLTAAELQYAASANQLKAAGIQSAASTSKGTLSTIGSTLLGILKPALVLIGSALAGAMVGDFIGDKLARRANPKDTAQYGAGDYLTELKQGIAVYAYQAGKAFQSYGKTMEENEKRGQEWFKAVGEALGLLEKQSEDTATSLGKVTGSMNEEKVVEAWQKWTDDLARITEEGAQKRLQIIKDAQDAEAASLKNYVSTVSSINAESNATFAQLAIDYAADMQEAEAEYASDRADIIRDSNDEIREIEADHQEALRKLIEDHNDRVADLVDQRDALGRVKEERRFNKERLEMEKGVNEAIAKERKETALRLQELASRYQQERAQRQAQYLADAAEAQAQQAAKLAEARAAHEEELKQIREAKAAQLLENQKAMQAERIRARQNFIEAIRDLDKSLLGERKLKNQYYTLMLQDVEQFLANWRAGIQGATPPATNGVVVTGTATGGTASPLWPGYASGGYASKGIYRLAEQGTEFVMNNRTTKAAERIVGGQLSQENMLQALSMFGAAKQGLSYNDNRRFNSGISARDRRAIRQDTFEVVQKVLSGVVA